MLRELNGSMGIRPASLTQTPSAINGGPELTEDDSEEVTFDVKIEAGLGGVCVCVCVCVHVCMCVIYMPKKLGPFGVPS